MKNFKKGFTIIELMVVVAIIAILSSVFLVILSGARNKANIVAFKEETNAYFKKASNDCLGATSAIATPSDTTITDWSAFVDNCANGDGTFLINATNKRIGSCSAIVNESGVTYTGC